MRKTTRREFAFQCGGAAAAVSLGQVLSAKEARAEGTSQLQMSIDIMGLNAVVDDRRTKRAEVLFMSPLNVGMPKHRPFLIANMNDVANAEDAQPTIVTVVPAAGGGVQQLALWDLTDLQVVVRDAGGAEITGGVTLSEGSDSAPLSIPTHPDDPESWRDLRYVANMQRICGDGEIARGLSSLDSPLSGGTASVAELVSGRIRFSGGALGGALPSREEHRLVEYRFSHRDGSILTQPLTDTIRWSVTHDAGGNYLALDLVPLRRNGKATRSLMLPQRGRACRVAISNLPTENPDGQAHHAMSMDEMAALHFGAYYKLLHHQPADQPVPQLIVPRERRATGAWVGPVCPPAMFTQN